MKNPFDIRAKIVGRAKWYKNPIKWWRERKMTKVMNILLEKEWNNGLKEKVELGTVEIMRYGYTEFINPRKYPTE